MKKRWAAFLTAAVLAAVLFPARSWAVELPVEAQAALLMERLGAQACVPLRGRPGRLVGGLVGGIPCAAYEQGAPYSAMQRDGLL